MTEKPDDLPKANAPTSSESNAQSSLSNAATTPTSSDQSDQQTIADSQPADAATVSSSSPQPIPQDETASTPEPRMKSEAAIAAQTEAPTPELPPLPLDAKTTREELLGDLLSPKAREARQSRGIASKPVTGNSSTGLTPLDLITQDIPDTERQVIGWLSRRKLAFFKEIAEFLAKQSNLTEAQAHEVLSSVIQRGYVAEALIDNEICYRIVFRGSVRRMGVGLPDEIWNRVQQDKITFLKSIPLFASLDDERLKDIANQVEEERYQRGDVILWQGRASDRVFFIKSGIVGITRYSPQTKEQKILNYLKAGDIMGEYSVIAGQGGTASATAAALSNVYAFTLNRPNFLHLLAENSLVSLELARLLATRLMNAGTRPSGAKTARVVLVIGAQIGVGATSLGTQFALMLASKTGQSVVYTEMPDSRRLVDQYNMGTEADTYDHPGGFAVVAQMESSMLPGPVRATLLLDQLIARFANIVIGVSGNEDETISYLCGYADQVVLVSSPEPESLQLLSDLTRSIRQQVNVEKVGIFTVIKRVKSEHAEVNVAGRADYDLAFSATHNPHEVKSAGDLPEDVARFTSTLIDRLGRTNAVSLYIPTTIDVNTVIDTTEYINRTLAFLGTLFGGATTTTMKAQGVWNSAEAGLVREEINIVRSYATQADLDANMQKILDYVEQLKLELRQEAMAVEINSKLMLI